MRWKCAISLCISVAGVRRVGDDRIGRAVMVERKRILAGADVAGIDAAQAEGFQMPDQRAVASTRLGEACGCRAGTGSAAPPLPVASGRNRLAALEVGSLAHLTRPLRSAMSVSRLLQHSWCAPAAPDGAGRPSNTDNAAADFALALPASWTGMSKTGQPRRPESRQRRSSTPACTRSPMNVWEASTPASTVAGEQRDTSAGHFACIGKSKCPALWIRPAPEQILAENGGVCGRFS